MKSLETRIPPLVVAAVVALLMWLLARQTAYAAVAIPFSYALAGLLVMSGLLVDIAGVLAFRRARTTVNPVNPSAAQSLVTHGIYRYTRNPMYLGFVFLLTAWAVFLGNVLTVAGLALFVAYMNRFQIAPEERALTANFGSAFESYKLAVRRWL